MLSATATAQLPAGLDVEFDRWLAELGDEHYQRTSHAYKGLGRRPEGGLLGVEHFPWRSS
jgi:hypothetical protein